MILKPGARLISAVCTAELMTVKAPKTDLEVTKRSTVGAPPDQGSAPPPFVDRRSRARRR